MLETVGTFIILCLLLLASIEVGFRLANRSSAGAPPTFESAPVIDGYIMTLLGLLLAFGFNTARDEFNKRSEVILSEAHAIRSSYLVFETLEPDTQKQCLSLLSQYLDSRKKYGKVINDPIDSRATYLYGRSLLSQMDQKLRVKGPSGQLSDEAREAAQAVDSMEEIAVQRQVLVATGRPSVVLLMLIAFSVIAGVLLGIGFKSPRREQRWHRIVFAVVTSAVLSMILDYASPRAGIVRVDAADQSLADVRR